MSLERGKNRRLKTVSLGRQRARELGEAELCANTTFANFLSYVEAR